MKYLHLKLSEKWRWVSSRLGNFIYWFLKLSAFIMKIVKGGKEMEYFKTEQLSKRLYRIVDFLGNCCYLAVGEKRACLLDTLDGFGNIRQVAESLTDKEIFVILTHGHIDHGAGCCFFDEVWMSHKDKALFMDHCSLETRLLSYANHPIAGKLAPTEYNPRYEGEIRDLKDGQKFDLGGLTIRMLAVPGHTQGMMVPLLEEERTIIFGDACGVGVLLFGENSSCVSAYRKSLYHLKQAEAEYDIILRNHGTFSSPKELLDNVIECCDDILAGKNRDQIVRTHNIDFHIAKPVDENENRLDGKQGNIKYTLDKAV